MNKKDRKRVSGGLPLGSAKEIERQWLAYRDPETGEPINFTWNGADFIEKETGKPYYREYFFEDLPNGVSGLPYPATGETVEKLWAQWWAWKRGEHA
jgi:hypothetical protein